MNYLVRTEEHEGRKVLHFFDDEKHLLGLLSYLIEENHLTGLGPMVAGMWRWNDDDSRDELSLNFTGETSEMENLDWKWEVWTRPEDPEEVPEVICGFTVTIPS